jgi:hypothetical protein
VSVQFIVIDITRATASQASCSIQREISPKWYHLNHIALEQQGIALRKMASLQDES